jgi:hypothetical protein
MDDHGIRLDTERIVQKLALDSGRMTGKPEAIPVQKSASGKVAAPYKRGFRLADKPHRASFSLFPEARLWVLILPTNLGVRRVRLGADTISTKWILCTPDARGIEESRY